MLRPVVMIACLTVLAGLVGPAQAPAAEAGKAVFKKCAACHQVGPEAKNRAGPVLNGVIGRQAGTYEGFKYRDSIVAAGEKGLVWTEEELSQYLDDPTGYLKTYLEDGKARSAMSFKLKNEQERLDVIAYIAAASETDSAAAAPAGDVAAAPELSEDEVVEAQVFDAAFLEDQAAIDAGKEIWFAQCTHCHGFKAYPGKAPKLKPVKYTPEFVFKRVYKGFKKMPAWKDSYSVEEIRQIVAYVKSPGFAP